MKKVFKLMLAVLAVSTLMFSSCKKDKDGVYAPGKKLKTIESYSIITSQGTEFKQLDQTTEFFWDGKKISKIVYKDDENWQMGSITFTYDNKKRFSEILHESSEDHTSLFKFFYEGKDLVKIVEYSDKDLDDIESDYIFTKSDSKITEIKHTIYKDDKKAEFSPLQLIIPQDIALDFERQSSTRKDVTTLSLTWEGSNVVKIVLSNGINDPIINEMTYDNKINPIKGLYTQSFYYSTAELYSANNILTDSSTLPNIGKLTTEYTYEYDKDDYPVKQTYFKSMSLSKYISSKQVIEYTYE